MSSPEVQAESDVINASWNEGGTSNGLADTIGLMVYEGDQALLYVKNYAAGSSQWDGFPIKVGGYASMITLALKRSLALNVYISVVMLNFNTTLSI